MSRSNSFFSGSIPLVILSRMLLFIVAAAAYADTLFYDFVWDDFYLIMEDHTVKSLNYLSVIFTNDFFGHQENDLVYGYYRPIVSLSYLLDYATWQKNPMGYHLTNVILHGLATVLVSLALTRISLSSSGAFFGALLFAVHPMHSESVAWISGRTDVLAFVFAMGAYLCHVGGRDGTPPQGEGLRRAAALACFALALLAKEMAVVVVLWMAAWERWIRGRDWRAAARSLLPYGAVLALYGIWRFVVLDVRVPVQSAELSLLDAVAAAPWTVARYLLWLAAPVGQSAYVRNPPIAGLADHRLWVGLAVVAGLFLAGRRIRSTRRRHFALLVMLAASFLPILNFIAISSPADMGNTMAERFLYFPSFPFLGLAALLADDLRAWLRAWRPERRWGRLVDVGMILAAAALLTAAMLRNRVWENNEVFYGTTVKTHPSALMWCNLATHYIYEQKWDEAKEALDKVEGYFPEGYPYLAAKVLLHVAQRQYAEAIELQEKIVKLVKRGRAVAYNNLAFLYRSTGNYNKAKQLLEEVIDNKRGYADVYYNLGDVQRAMGSIAEAIGSYEEAVRRRPDNMPMATALAIALMQAHRLEEAARVIETQLGMHRDNPGLLNNLGIVYKKMGRLEEAASQFQRSLAQDPRYVKARLNLAGTLLKMDRQDAAVRELRRIVRENGGDPEGKQAREILGNLGR